MVTHLPCMCKVAFVVVIPTLFEVLQIYSPLSVGLLFIIDNLPCDKHPPGVSKTAQSPKWVFVIIWWTEVLWRTIPSLIHWIIVGGLAATMHEKVTLLCSKVEWVLGWKIIRGKTVNKNCSIYLICTAKLPFWYSTPHYSAFLPSWDHFVSNISFNKNFLWID